MDFGFKCQDIYRKSREKIPVFPMDWLIIENIRDLGKYPVDQGTLVALKKGYLRLMKDEKKYRRQAEQLMHESENQKRKLTIRMMPNREHIQEDAYQCYYCTDFCYISIVRCLHHKIQYCLYHDFMCGCKYDNIVIDYRYSNAELEDMERTLERLIQNAPEEEDEMSSFELIKK